MPVEVIQEEKYRFAATVRQHKVVIDQSIRGGGTDEGMDPVELFVTAMASCVAYYAVHYMTRHAIATEGSRVTADWEMQDKPYRVGSVAIQIHLPPGFPQASHKQLLAVCRGCTIHHTLSHPPSVEYTVQES
jgi:uncharacterized OsmC-like protein